MEYKTPKKQRVRMNKSYRKRKKLIKSIRLKVNDDIAEMTKGSKRPKLMQEFIEKVCDKEKLPFGPRYTDYTGMDESYIVVPVDKELYAKFEEIIKPYGIKTNRCLALLFDYEARKKFSE